MDQAIAAEKEAKDAAGAKGARKGKGAKEAKGDGEFLSDDDRALGVVRVKPRGAGGGGVENREIRAGSETCGVAYSASAVSVDGKHWKFPKTVVPPQADNDALFADCMPAMIDGFFDGYNVNLLAYGQTGSGKTHTMFGPPGILAEAAGGPFAAGIWPHYGLFPRGMIAIFERVRELRKANAGVKNYALCGAAVELSMQGNVCMFSKAQSQREAGRKLCGGGSTGVHVDQAQRPPAMYGQREVVLETEADLARMFAALAVRNTACTGMNDSSSRSHCSGGEKYPILRFPGEISHRCFTGCQKYYF